MEKIIEQAISALDRIDLFNYLSEDGDELMFEYGDCLYTVTVVNERTVRVDANILNVPRGHWTTLCRILNDFNATEEFKTLYIEDGKLKLRQTIVTTSEESAERELFFEFPIMVLVTIPYISDLIAGDDVMGKHVITPSETEKEVLDAIDYSMVRDFDGQHWGFRTIRGDFIRSGWWCDVCQYSEGLAAVSDSSGNYGYVGYNGILAINPKWKYAGPFSDGMAVVLGDNKLYGFIDRYGSESIPCQWKKAGPFKDGIAQVWDVKGNQYDIRKDGTIVES